MPCLSPFLLAITNGEGDFSARNSREPLWNPMAKEPSHDGKGGTSPAMVQGGLNERRCDS